MFKDGDTIGPYTLKKILGSGASGIVWLAQRKTSIINTNVALKMFLQQTLEIEQIKKEAEVWQQVSGHPNILPFVEAHTYDGITVIVSEYASEGSLESWLFLNENQTVPLKKVVSFVLGILSGLEYLHQKRIIHRDLKPANILLQKEVPRLADFGIARLLKSTKLTTNIMGTPAYMAPETFSGKILEQSDLWSVGVIFYQLLTKTLPFPQTDLMFLLSCILKDSPNPLPQTVPLVLQNVIFTALEKEPSKRFGSANNMYLALEDAFQQAEHTKNLMHLKNLFQSSDQETVKENYKEQKLSEKWFDIEMQLIQEEAIEKVKQIQNPALLKTLFGDVPVNQKTIEEMISSDLNEFYEESRREIAVLLLEDVKFGLLLAIENWLQRQRKRLNEGEKRVKKEMANLSRVYSEMQERYLSDLTKEEYFFSAFMYLITTAVSIKKRRFFDYLEAISSTTLSQIAPSQEQEIIKQIEKFIYKSNEEISKKLENMTTKI